MSRRRSCALLAAALVAVVGTTTAAAAPAATASRLRAAWCCIRDCHHASAVAPRDCCCNVISDDRVSGAIAKATVVLDPHALAALAHQTMDAPFARGAAVPAPLEEEARAAPIYLATLSLRL